MLDLDSPIVPGRGLGGIEIGCDVAILLASARPLRVITIPPGGSGGGAEETVVIHSFGPIRTWSVDGRVRQVGAFEGYRGTTSNGVGIGSTVAAVEAAFGTEVVASGQDLFTVPDAPGLGFESTEWTTGTRPDPATRVVQMYVFDPAS